MSGLNEEASYKGDCLDAFSKTNRLPALSGLPGQTPAKAGQVPRRRELLHGDPDFGSDPNGCTLTDAWNATEQDHRFCPTQNGGVKKRETPVVRQRQVRGLALPLPLSESQGSPLE